MGNSKRFKREAPGSDFDNKLASGGMNHFEIVLEGFYCMYWHVALTIECKRSLAWSSTASTSNHFLTDSNSVSAITLHLKNDFKCSAASLRSFKAFKDAQFDSDLEAGSNSYKSSGRCPYSWVRFGSKAPFRYWAALLAWQFCSVT